MDSEHAYLKTTTHLMHPKSYVPLRASCSLTSHQRIHHVRLEIAFSLPRWSLNLAAVVSKKVEKFSLHAQRGVSAR